jgi:hypothetical protein
MGISRYFKYCIALAALLAAVTGCGRRHDPLPPPSGPYQYEGYDEQGTTVVRGFLTLEQLDYRHFGGTWELYPVGEARQLGLEGDAGNLVGAIQGSILTINLNPDVVDGNVILTGQVQGDSYAGTWEYIGLAGHLNGGSFAAVRIKSILPPMGI